jgi:hypothetical protein
MSQSFFKFRKRFDFNAHKYDIGRPIFQNKILEDNFLILGIYNIDESEYDNFYEYQLSHFLKIRPSQEETFFNHVREIVINRIKYLKRQDPFSSKYASGLEQTHKLENFLDYLKTIDRWHKTEPIESVIGEKDNQINYLKQRITELEKRLKEASKYDVGEKIVISKGSLPAFMNLIHQLQELTL